MRRWIGWACLRLAYWLLERSWNIYAIADEITTARFKPKRRIVFPKLPNSVSVLDPLADHKTPCRMCGGDGFLRDARGVRLASTAASGPWDCGTCGGTGLEPIPKLKSLQP